MGSINTSADAPLSNTIAGATLTLITLPVSGVYTVPAGKLAKLIGYYTNCNATAAFTANGINVLGPNGAPQLGACSRRMVPQSAAPGASIGFMLGINSGALSTAPNIVSASIFIDGDYILILKSGQTLVQNSGGTGGYLFEIIDL